MAGPQAAAQPLSAITIVPEPAPAELDELGSLLDLALQATAANAVALLLPDNGQLRVLQSRGANAPAPDETVALEGTVSGEAWYRARLVTGPEPPPKGRQGALWQDDRTIDVMAAPVLSGGRAIAGLVLYHSP